MMEIDLKEGAKAEIDRLRKARNIIERTLAEAPEGCLEISHNRGKSYYRQKIIDGAGAHRKYLATNVAEQHEILEKLATKGYLKKLELAVKKEESALANFAEKYKPEEKYNIYNAMPEDRKKFVKKFFYTLEERAAIAESKKRASLKKQFDVWNMQPEYANQYRVSDRVIETRDGHLVRSKSERMIADELAEQSGRLAYKYEVALDLSRNNLGKMDNGWKMDNSSQTTAWNNYDSYTNYNRRIYYPDFVIFDKENAREYVWEHFGMMDTPAYANREFIAKLLAYENAGYRLGENFIGTFESSERPLQLSQVKCMLEQILAYNIKST